MNKKATIAFVISAVLPLLDSSLINVLFPPLAASFHADDSQIQWGISGYMLATTAGIILTTSALQRFGSRTVWIISLVTFAMASAGVGVATNISIFLIARLIQGLACGFIMPSVQSMVVELVGKENMRTALATIGLPAVIAPAFGPLIGGALIDLVGWRALFLINIPLAALGLLIARKSLPTPVRTAIPLGLTQALPALFGGVGLLYLLSETGHFSLPQMFLGILLCGGSLTYFWWVDLRSPHPLLDMSVYHHTKFRLSMFITLIVGAVFYGGVLATSLHLQEDLDQSSWLAGLLLAIQGGGSWLSRNQIKTRWKNHNPFTLINAGLFLTAATTFGIEFINAPSLVGLVMIGVLSLIRGCGLGICTLLVLSLVYEVLPTEKSPVAGTHSRLILNYGGALGTVIVGSFQIPAYGLGLTLALICLGGIAVTLIVLGAYNKRHATA